MNPTPSPQSGKDRATEYLMELFGAAAGDCVAMCDDDNDIDMAQSVGHAYVPGITSESMDEVSQHLNPRP